MLMSDMPMMLMMMPIHAFIAIISFSLMMILLKIFSDATLHYFHIITLFDYAADIIFATLTLPL